MTAVSCYKKEISATMFVANDATTHNDELSLACTCLSPNNSLLLPSSLCLPLPSPSTPADDGYSVIPNSQFVVTRTAFRNDTSSYYVNDKKSTMVEVRRCRSKVKGSSLSCHDQGTTATRATIIVWMSTLFARPPCCLQVTSLLKSRGIDLDHNRFLILQGEVESIAMMKPKAQAPGEEGASVCTCDWLLFVVLSLCYDCGFGFISPLSHSVSCMQLMSVPAPSLLHCTAGLLEYLEDIIGSAAYVERIAEAEKVTEALSSQVR